MVSRELVDKTAKQAGFKYASGDSDRVTKVFEAGMHDILREIAIVKMYEVEDEGRFELGDEYEKQVEKHATLMNEIKELLPEKHRHLINEMDDVRSRIMVIEMDDFFIRGFIEGYKFLRTLNYSYRGEALDVRR